ncbi:hypothetical protein DY000_02046636 [Brassica cretica]|uniref:BHLH domain-containing protein n=1 Tax=Brassica cretica TaxID=69181 RepID=A0ABQ7F8X8_BRACR|nr:hypothetical protein DY000_02046636 [Brassica cretica]
MDLAAPPDSPVSPTRDKGESEVRDEGSTVGATISLAEAKKTAPNWLSVAQDKKVLKKFEVEETNRGEGVGSETKITQQQEVENEEERAQGQVVTNAGGTKVAVIEDEVLQQAVEKAVISDQVGVDEANNWSLVSPEKVGRSSVANIQGNQLEDFISASKFAVLSVDEKEEEQEEEGEIKDPGFQLSVAAFPALETSKKVDQELSVDNQSAVVAGQQVEEVKNKDQRNQRKRQNRLDDDEKRVRNGDCPFTKAKSSNCDMLDRNKLQTYASLEKMLHKTIFAIQQLKKKGSTNTSSAPKHQYKEQNHGHQANQEGPSSIQRPNQTQGEQCYDYDSFAYNPFSFNVTDLRTNLFEEGGNEVPQPMDQYMEPAQY